MTTCVRFVVTVVAAIMAAAPSFAQPTDDPRATARMQVGPFYVTPTFALTNFGVDINVFNQSGDTAPDFTFSVEPHTDVWLPLARRAMVQMSLTPGLTYYHTFSSEHSCGPQL